MLIAKNNFVDLEIADSKNCVNFMTPEREFLLLQILYN